MSPFDLARMNEYIQPTAYALSRQFPMVEKADVYQELVLWFYANPVKAEEYWTHPDPRQGDRLIMASLRNRGRAFCHREKARIEGYKPSDQVFYNESDLRGTTSEPGLLSYIFDREHWATPPTTRADRGNRNRQDPALGNNWIATLADVACAWEKLGDPDRTIIAMHYGEGLKQREIGTEMGLSPTQVSDAVSRGVRTIVEILGGRRPVQEKNEVSRRKALSNAQALAQTERDFNGE